MPILPLRRAVGVLRSVDHPSNKGCVMLRSADPPSNRVVCVEGGLKSLDPPSNKGRGSVEECRSSLL